MRHQVAGKHLNRDSDHRRALLKNLVRALIANGEITTTYAKAKAVQGHVDSLITTAKKGGQFHLKQVDQTLNRRHLTETLVKEVLPVLSDHSSGYTRIVRTGQRRGDNAMMVTLSLVRRPTPKVDEKTKKVGAKKSKDTKKASAKTEQPIQPAEKKQRVAGKLPIGQVNRRDSRGDR